MAKIEIQRWQLRKLIGLRFQQLLESALCRQKEFRFSNQVG